ncbi:46208_t:CDS:1, partial [Gigaspora margarita]
IETKSGAKENNNKTWKITENIVRATKHSTENYYNIKGNNAGQNSTNKNKENTNSLAE